MRLESTTFSLYDNASRNSNQLISGYPKSDTLYYSISTQDKYYYTAVYTFRIIGLAGSAVAIKPVGQISSGTQMKHNDVSDSAISNTINLSAATVSMAISKSLSETATYDSGTNKLTFSYTISLANSGSSSQNVDLVTDTPDASLAFVAGSAQFNSATISDPSASTLNSSDLIFSGPFTVPANTTRTLTYRMIQRNGCTSGSFSYTNSATATLGQLIIGSGASTYSLVVGSGTCANTTTTVTVTNPSLAPIAITNAASGITSTAATFNASVDPNAQSGWTVSFEWGTSASLTSTAITLADLTTASSTAYSVSTSRTGLSTGTTYYYRIKLSKTGSTTVYGEIVSFTTFEPVADPTASTTNITNVSVSGSNVSVTFNGTIDPNQVTNGAKVRFEYAKRNSSSTACIGNIDTTNYAPSSTTFVQIEDTTNTTDLILSGSFPTSVEYLNSSSSNVVVLNTGASGFNSTYFCFRIVGLYNASTANWATSVYGDWVAFTASNKTAQTITYTQPANMVVGGTSTSATATATSGLAVTYSSADTSICTVNSSTGEITAVSEGTCTLTASQIGNDSYYEATAVSVSFTITAVAPTATTVAASSTSTTTATINGTINGGGASTTTTFCYGTASNLTGCSTVTATQSPVTGATNTSVSYNLTGLSSGTTYYFRVSGTNSIGSATGSILNFTTKVTVTYDANSATSGSVPVDASSPYDVNSSVTVKANTGTLARAGYTFSGWNTNSAATGTSYTASGTDTFTLSTTSVVLYAKWTALTYSITYDANGGTGSTASQSGSGASSVTLRANGFSNGANNFVGWSTSSGAGNSKTYDASQVLSITTDLSLTLYAVWSASPTYTATLVSATGGTATQSATTLISGSTLEIVATASTGYTFSSWSCTMNSVTTTYNTSSVSFTVTANVTCTPTFTINSYNFGYDANSGTGSAPANTVSKNYNSSVTVASNTYTRNNYRFSNWHTTSAGTGGTSYSATDTFNMPASNVTLYAQWTQVWTITVGTLTNGTGSSISITISPSAAGETVTLTISPASGKQLKAGTISAAYTGGSASLTNTSSNVYTFSMPSANVTVTAEFESISAGSYTVTVNAATGGSATSADASVTSGGSTTLTATASSGYTFTSWSCTGGGTLSSTTDNPATLSNITADATCTPTFTANASSGTRNTPTNNPNAASKRIVVNRVSNQLNTQVNANQRPVFVGTNSTFTPGNSTNRTESVANSASTTTSNSGGIVAVVTNNSTSPSAASNSVEVSAANTTAQTEVIRNSNVPAAVSVNRDNNSGRLAVTATNGWTGRLSVAVVDDSSGQAVESFVEIVVAPTPVSAPQINVNPPANPFAPVTPNAPNAPNTPNRPSVNPGLNITWQPPNSEVVGYVVTVNDKVACTTTTSSCQPHLLIGPKSKVEIFAQGNDNTFSPATQLPAFRPTRPIPALVVNFAVASPVLSKKFKADLRNLAKVMNKEGFTRVDITGHTDSTGQAVNYDNQRLSDARAKATMDYLKRFVPRLGAATAAFAYEKLIADESTPDGLYSNRRAEVSVW